jgi:hypothetical protein
MQAVFDPPMPPYRLGKTRRLIVQTGEVVASLPHDLPPSVALRFDHSNEVEPFPLGLVLQPIEAIHGPVTPDLDPSMVGIQSLMEAVWDVLEAFGLSLLKELHHTSSCNCPWLPFNAST